MTERASPFRESLSRLAPFLTWAVLLLGYQSVFRSYFPGPNGSIGHDFKLTLPLYLDAYLWFHVNGPLPVPWFSPSFCGGQPFFADPQYGYYAIPTLLTLALDPLEASFVTLIGFASAGFWGFYLLLRRHGRVSRPAALLGGGLYMFDGFLSHRMVTGENGFHPLPLLPWIALALLDRAAWPCGPFRRGGNVLVAGLLVAYWLQGGLTTLMIPAGLSVVALACLVTPRAADLRRFVTRGVGAAALAGAICASKLAASGALMSHFPRSDYPLPGFQNPLDAVRFTAWSLFGASDDVYRASKDLLHNDQWKVWPHEWAYGLTPVAAIFLGLGVVAAVRARRAAPAEGVGSPGAERATTIVRAVVVAVLFALPIALLIYTPGWNAVLKSLPIVGQTSFPFRWIILYAPAIVWGAAVGADRALSGRMRTFAVAAGLAAVWLFNAGEPDRFYFFQLFYNPDVIVDATAAVRNGERTPRITAMTATKVYPEELDHLEQNDTLVYGASTLDCYNPVFGYRLEHYPWGPIRPGPALAEVDGVLNVKNPACYVFPEENGCVPGDHFRLDQRAEAEAFLSYRPFAFEKSARQKVADTVTMSALAAAVLFVGWTALRLALADLARRRGAPGPRA